MSIKIDQLSLSFRDKELFCLSHEFKAEAIHLIKGPSGCGKSSLLRLIAGLSPAEKGQILVNDEAIHNQQKHRLNCHYIFQQPVIFPGSVSDNLLMAFDYSELEAPKELEQELKKVFPEEIALDQDAQQLSVGQKQRLALLRAFLLKPNYLLCDEVTSGLDEASRQLAEKLISQFCLDGGTVIFVTHVEKSFENFTKAIHLNMSSSELITQKTLSAPQSLDAFVSK